MFLTYSYVATTAGKTEDL